MSGYLKGSAVAASEEKIRRFVFGLDLREQDAETLLAMVRKINGELNRRG